MHSCEICGKRYRSNFSIQYRLHRNRKTFTCKVCQEDLNERLLLNNHPPIHTEDKPFSLKYMSDLICQEQKFLKGHNTTGIEHTLGFESKVVLESMSRHATPSNKDNKQSCLEDYILPTKPTEIENTFHYASTPKLELILSLARVKHENIPHFSTSTTGGVYDLTNNLISVQTNNLEFNEKPVCTFNNAQNIIDNRNSLASISILQSLLTKPVEDVHNKSLSQLPKKDEFGVATLHSSILRSRLINHVNSKNSDTSVSILESLLTKPGKDDPKKFTPISPNKIKNEDQSVPTSLLKCLLLASKTGKINESIPAMNIEKNIENKTPSRNLFKVVDVVSLAGELQLSDASVKPEFSNDAFLRSPHTFTKSNSAEVIYNHHHLLPATVNDIELFQPTHIPKCKNSINFQNAFGESGIHELRKGNNNARK